MLDDICGAGAESTTCTERAGERTYEHVNLGGIDVLGFSQSATSSTHNTEGPGLVEHEAEFVAELELDLESSAMALMIAKGYIPA